MTIKITNGRGIGQVRNIIKSDRGINPKIYISPDWEIIPDETSVYEISGPTVKIPGWDPINDKNEDGYVDDFEYENRINKNASARFKWESRVTRGTEYWSSNSSLCKPNFFNNRYKEVIKDYYLSIWKDLKIQGYYIDDAFLLIDYKELPVLLGGHIWEYNGGSVGHDEEMIKSYRDAYVNLNEFLRLSGVQWAGANISANNLWMSKFYIDSLKAFNFFTLEDLFWDTLGYADNYGIMRRSWAIAGYAKKGIISFLVGQKNRLGGIIDVWGNTKEAWEYATLAQLAQYYLVNFPGKTVFGFWSKSMVYGSGLTNTSSNSAFYFWKPGVPANMAYPSFSLLKVDIGKPMNKMSNDYEPIYYIQVGSYRIVGNSTDNFLKNIPGTEEGTLEVYPTYIFYLWKSQDNLINNIPKEAVLAREYTKGLVLYRALALRPSSFEKLLEYTSATNSITVNLPGLYRKVNYDGTLGPVTNQITMRGFEGAILVKAEYYPPGQEAISDLKKYFKISLFSEKEGDIINYSPYLRNISTTTLIKTKVFFPLSSNEKYIDNSAYLTIDNVKYPVSYSYSNHQLRITILYLSPKKHVLLRWKMRR